MPTLQLSRPSLKTLRLTVVIFIGVLTLSELVLAAFLPAPDYRRGPSLTRVSAFRSSPWIIQPKPNTRFAWIGDAGKVFVAQTNQDGLRNSPQITRQKPPGTLRILALGDSFTFGMPVADDETYPAQLETCLNQALPSLKIEVLNAGFNGFSFDGYYVFYRQLGYLYEPDIVMIGLAGETDLQDIKETNWQVDEKGLPIRVTSILRYVDNKTGELDGFQKPINYRIPILRDLNIYQYLYQYTRPYSPNYAGLPADRIISDPEAPSEEWNAALEDAFQKSLFILTNFQEELEAEGKHLLMILIPDRSQYKNATTPLGQKNPQARFRAAFEQAQIDYIDLLPTFSAVNRNAMYLTPGVHFSAQGYQLAGQTICSYLLEKGWLSSAN